MDSLLAKSNKLRPKPPQNILIKNHHKFVSNIIAFEGAVLFAVDVDWGGGGFSDAGDADADVGVFAFAGAVDDAAHDGDF